MTKIHVHDEPTRNRKLRRAEASQRRPDTRLRVAPTGAVEDYRVPADAVALTLDIYGRSPSTIQIPAADLAGVLDRVAALVNGMSYPQVLHLLSAAIKRVSLSTIFDVKTGKIEHGI